MAKKTKTIKTKTIPDSTIHFEFKEPFFDDKGNFSHLVTPRSDPQVYEDSFDFIFKTEDEAKEYIKERIEDETLEQEEVDTWVLVKVETTIVK